jgi:hypothetical protein
MSETSKPVTLSELSLILFFVGVIEEIQENHKQFQWTLSPMRLTEITLLYAAAWTTSKRQQGTNPCDSKN